MEYELGGSCPAREAGYLRKRRGGEKSQEWKRIEKKQVRWMFMHVHPPVRSHPD